MAPRRYLVIARSAPIGAPVADATADHLHTEHAQHRLGQLLNDLHNLGADADGDIGEADPIAAVDNLLATREFDEIILSTCPNTSRSGSGWTSRTGCTVTRDRR
jgi:hypothetical protein